MMSITEEMEARGWFAPGWFCIEVRDQLGWIYHGGVVCHERFPTLEAARTATAALRSEHPEATFRVVEENGKVTIRIYP